MRCVPFLQELAWAAVRHSLLEEKLQSKLLASIISYNGIIADRTSGGGGGSREAVM